MDIITSLSEIRERTLELRGAQQTIALVPTMGYLHEGHLSLLRIAREKADVVILSIFVNPIQFGANEDFHHYPRDLERDLSLAEKEKVDIVFTPSAEDLYPKGFDTIISVPHLSNHLCGLSRPDFLQGVATIITILFHLTSPHIAIFGEKDYQQLLVIRQLVKDLQFQTTIIGAPIFREPDGLAMSSRNAYLTPTERTVAPFLYQTLQTIQEMSQKGIHTVSVLNEKARSFLSQEPSIQLEYLEFMDAKTLAPLTKIRPPAFIAIAAKLGKTRLIDNLIIS